MARRTRKKKPRVVPDLVEVMRAREAALRPQVAPSPAAEEWARRAIAEANGVLGASSPAPLREAPVEVCDLDFEGWPLGVLATSRDASNRASAATLLAALYVVGTEESAEALRLADDVIEELAEKVTAWLEDSSFASLPRPERIAALRAWSKGLGEDDEPREPSAFPP